MAHSASRAENLNSEVTDTERLGFRPFRRGPRQPDILGPFGSDDARPLIELKLVDAARVLAFEQDPVIRANERQRARQMTYDAYMSGTLRLKREQHVGDTHETISHFVDVEIERHLGAVASNADRTIFVAQRDANLQVAELLAGARHEVKELEARELRFREARNFLRSAGVPESVIRVFDEVSGLGEILRQEAAIADGSTGPTGTKVLDTAETFSKIVGQDDLGAAPKTVEIQISSSAEHAA